jgi:hypothetical protein
MPRYRREIPSDAGAPDAFSEAQGSETRQKGLSIIEEVRMRIRKDPRFKLLMDRAITRAFARDVEHAHGIPPPENPEPRGTLTGLTRAQLLAAYGQYEDRL